MRLIEPFLEFASGLKTVLFTILEKPITVDCLVPPRVLMYEMAARPGGKREPETIAAMVSSVWCLVRSNTGLGSGFLPACAM